MVVNDLGATYDGAGADSSPARLVVDEILKCGGEAVASYDSVADWKGAQRIIELAVERFGRIDILINNAGILRDKSLLKMEPEDYRQVVAVHLDGTFYCTKAALSHMRRQNYGRIVSASSPTAIYGNFGQANYGAAKMGIAGLMHCVKQEGARYNIMANTIVPTAGTRMTATVMPPELTDQLKPEFVAPLVAWMCSALAPSAGKYSPQGAAISAWLESAKARVLFWATRDHCAAIAERMGDYRYGRRAGVRIGFGVYRIPLGPDQRLADSAAATVDYGTKNRPLSQCQILRPSDIP